VSLAQELLKTFEPDIETITLVPSDGGRFEVQVNGRLLYSKLETRRHAEPGEVAALVEKFKP
jgi:selenoprotein W-related protein